MIASWISERVNEASSHQGLIVAAAAVAVLFFAVPLTKVVLWGALAWGVWSVMRNGN